MPTKSNDQGIVATLTQKIGAAPKAVEYDEEGHLLKLNLSGLGLFQLPPEIEQLSNLRELYLRSNRLSHLPPEMWQLSKLHILDLSFNRLSQVSPEIRQLINLERLYLRNNDLRDLPPEIGQLRNLRELYLHNNRLGHFPSEIGQLANLWMLYLYHNHLSRLPPEIGQLTHLLRLYIGMNHLGEVPSEIWRLTDLRSLGLSSIRLSELSPQIRLLTHLQELYLVNNHLRDLPPEIGQLTHLQKLDLSSNQLRELPPEIEQLSNLRELGLSNNHLMHLPPEIGQLTSLRRFNLNNNLNLLTPPSEIVVQGTEGILAFLRELQRDGVIRYEAKLLIVGEAGMGKSSLLRALRNETFDSQLSATHGIEVEHLKLPHPNRPLAEITLNTWDFGGQQIYHTTHQFFLTKRSFYVVVWNARLGVEQGRLNYWLSTIKALAPEAPVLLVATHIDELPPDLNYQLYKDIYPQLVGSLSVSNKTGAGLAELKAVLAQQSARLPLMGQPWPRKWLMAEQSLLLRPEHHIDADKYASCCLDSGVEVEIARGTLANYLHDLGKILYFRDDYILSNLVVLKPNWVTKAISRVLTDEVTRKANGILAHSELSRIWAIDEDGQAYELHLYPVFLRLMERFDLSYQIEADIPGTSSTHSLIPQLLSHQPPVNLSTWPKTPVHGQTQVEMVYRLDFVPAGIMSWFIVRTHSYTKNLHWREGVLLEYQEHQARVELNPMLREIRLLVWGVQPQNFFTILRNTVDIILDRFKGLTIRREVPCICHWERAVAEPCPRFYRYEDLVRRMEAKRYKVECPDTFVEVSVPTLLYGIHTSTDQQMMVDIQQEQQEIHRILDEMRKEEQHKLDVILERLSQQSELIVRNFTRQWNWEMKKIEAECPNTFVLVPSKGKLYKPKDWISHEFRLHLVCQHPPCPHKVKGEGYPLRQAEGWWITVSPWLNQLIKFLKFGVPVGKAIGAVVDEVDMKQMQADIDLMEEITKDLPEFAALDSLRRVDKEPLPDQEHEAVGPALRALHSFLKETDPSQIWGRLHKTLTPDGNILWLCDEHCKEYEAKPLQLDV